MSTLTLIPHVFLVGARGGWDGRPGTGTARADKPKSSVAFYMGQFYRYDILSIFRHVNFCKVSFQNMSVNLHVHTCITEKLPFFIIDSDIAPRV